ncbi:MAG: hypothetical protein M3156_02115, partial [Thermoproteota archaeon]|nr:hypothetical protein [Thermoproteota archaeon]
MTDKKIQTYFYGITMILLISLIFLHSITIIPIGAYATTDPTNRSTIVTDGPADAKANTSAVAAPQSTKPILEEFSVPTGSRPHDVAPAPDGIVWYTAQGSGELGRLDPATSETHHISLGEGSAPHGVIVGPDGAPWITDGGLNAIVRVDPVTEEVQIFPLPADTGY